MAIIKYSKDQLAQFQYLNIYPDQFKTEKEKEDPSYIKNTMDYFASRAYAEYVKNRNSFVKNYDLVKGILRPEDFYQEPEIKDFADLLESELQLPTYVKHYSILSTPINELVGEITKRPDTYKVKAFDDESRSEEMQFKTETLHKFIINQAKAKIIEKAALEGVEIKEEELEEMTIEKVKEDLDDYTSVAEMWGNHTLSAIKAEYILKEKSEDAFRDLLIASREYFLVYEDNSKTGFNIVVVNPKNAWFLTTPDKKYISDPSGRNQGAYAGGTVEVMEISEIMEAFPDITKEEIDHLRTSLQDFGLINVRESNLGNQSVKPGIDSIVYDTYDPLVLQQRMLIESEMKENNDGLKDFLGLTSNVSAFGYKYVVIRSYFVSKKKIGKVTYLDEMGNEQSLLVDELYKSGTIPTQTSIQWGWMNQWYQGVKIGPDIYHMKPLKMFNYLPLIGVVHEQKNTESRSLVDLMKPFQVIYNICMNQLYSLLEKEIGNVAVINVRRIPKLKDGDDQDSLDTWEAEARNRGIVFDDDSPENMKGAISNTSIAKNLDLTRTNEIQSRYNLAMQMKMECWELIGMSRQRLGSTTASETATGINTALSQSYAQTEPLFVTHEYVMGQVYQAILDAAQFIESSKEESSLSYITSEGQNAFIKVNGADLKLRDLKVFPTNRPEDNQMYNEIRALAQPLMQNGGSIYDVIELYSTKSLRQLKKTFRDLRDQQMAMQQQDAKIKQQQLEQQAKQMEMQIMEARREKEADRINANTQNQLDRINKKEIALISQLGRNENATQDTNNDGLADALQITEMTNRQMEAQRKFQIETDKMNREFTLQDKKMSIEEEKLQVDRENQKNDLEIAKINARNRSTKAKA